MTTFDTYICGCDPHAVTVIEGVPWVWDGLIGWHNPEVPHPGALYWPAGGDPA